jgi:hypothetical protein
LGYLDGYQKLLGSEIADNKVQRGIYKSIKKPE